MLGTLVDITVSGADAERLGRALESGFGAVARVHALMSFHEAQSDVSRVNRDAARRPVRVDPLTWTVLHVAGRVAEASQGNFDVTVGARLVEWGFLPRSPEHARTDPTASWRDVQLLEDGRVRFRKPLAIDLGGIAKGFAVDQAVDAINAEGVDSACVNAGGDLRVCGDAAEPLFVRYPGAPCTFIDAGVLRDEAAATSADADTRRPVDAVWLSPLIDPKRGAACDAFASVTVRAPTCMLADALTKVVSCAPGGGLEVLARFGASALVLDRQGVVGTAGAVPRAPTCRC
jgi:thiamine biosynthesis lipoprotein